MDMRWLDDVLILLEERNMSRAAARRHITQPAFSRRIRSFEGWLGVDVLERKINRIEIGPALVANEEEIRALVTHLKELRTRIAHHDPATSVVAIAVQHAPMVSTFPDMASSARATFPGLRFRMRAGNLNDCTSLFLRGDTSMLLCYEARDADPLPFGAEVQREIWAQDYLVPVVGGTLRDAVHDRGEIAEDAPAIVYPDDSYFGEVLNRSGRMFGTAGSSANPIFQTAFSSGTRELVLSGLGVGWLPFSMVHSDIESGALASLCDQCGREPLDAIIYAHKKVAEAAELIGFWAVRRQIIWNTSD